MQKKNINKILEELQYCCIDKQVKPLYNDIEYKDYFTPLKRFKNIDKSKSKIDDEVINYYIKCRNDISIIFLHPRGLNSPIIDDFYKEIKKYGDIHYNKKIQLTYEEYYNVVYNLYATNDKRKKNVDILEKIDKSITNKKEDIHTVKVIVYTLKDKTKKINGSKSEYKQFLRKMLLDYDINNNNNVNPEDPPTLFNYLHISDDINQSYEYSNMFFHKKTLEFIKKQLSWRMLEMRSCVVKFNILKNFMYDYSQLEVEKLLIFSSAILFAYGIREFNDIDCYLKENDIIKPEDINLLINKNKFLDITYKGNIYYNQGWENELNNKASLVGKKYFNDFFEDDNSFFYFQGLKFMSLENDIILRSNRKRPDKTADLLVIKHLYNLNFKIKIPSETLTYNLKLKKDIIKKVNPAEYINDIKFYLETRYYIYLTPDEIKYWIDGIKLYGGGNYKNYLYQLEDKSDNKKIYLDQSELIKMGYNPLITIYKSSRPYLYKGENFYFNILKYFCNKKPSIIKEKQGENLLRIATFNTHAFISRCNQGIAPLFKEGTNPFHYARDIKNFISLFKELNADILCLQNITPIIKNIIKEDITDYEYIKDNFNYEYFNELMEKIGYKYKIIGSTENGKFYKNEKREYYCLANAIYSKIKLEEGSVYGFNFLNRNIITTVINHNNKKIRIFNTELESLEIENKNIDKDEKQTIKQYEVLNDFLNEYKEENKILCGDFNINLYEKKNGLLYQNWEQKTEYINKNYKNSLLYKRATNFLKNDQTDYILSNGNIKVIYSNVVETNISMNYLIYADIDLI